MLSQELVAWSFTKNPYDSCVANKTRNGKQCTVVWNVDDLKIPQSKTRVVDDVIRDLEMEFGKETPLSKSRGKVHNYLGIILDFCVQRPGGASSEHDPLCENGLGKCTR
jgi:hypothetical protein